MSGASEEAGQGDQKRKQDCFRPEDATCRDSKRPPKSIQAKYAIGTTNPAFVGQVHNSSKLRNIFQHGVGAPVPIGFLKESGTASKKRFRILGCGFVDEGIVDDDIHLEPPVEGQPEPFPGFVINLRIVGQTANGHVEKQTGIVPDLQKDRFFV